MKSQDSLLNHLSHITGSGAGGVRGSMVLQRQCLVKDCWHFSKCCMYQSVTRQVEGENNCLVLWPLLVDDNKATTNHHGYIVFNMVISNIKASYMYKTEGNKRRRKPHFYLLMQSKSFEKRYKCVNCHVSRQDMEHSSQNWDIRSGGKMSVYIVINVFDDWGGGGERDILHPELNLSGHWDRNLLNPENWDCAGKTGIPTHMLTFKHDFFW
jgi:hypothetical protein